MDFALLWHGFPKVENSGEISGFRSVRRGPDSCSVGEDKNHGCQNPIVEWRLFYVYPCRSELLIKRFNSFWIILSKGLEASLLMLTRFRETSRRVDDNGLRPSLN